MEYQVDVLRVHEENTSSIANCIRNALQHGRNRIVVRNLTQVIFLEDAYDNGVVHTQIKIPISQFKGFINHYIRLIVQHYEQ